jgi:hypothetical protein
VSSVITYRDRLRPLLILSLASTEVFAVPFKDFVGYQTSHWTPRMARRYVMRDKSVVVTPFLNYVHEKGIDTGSEHTVA